MVAEVLKSYLVSLGVQVDQPGFNQLKTTLDQTSGAVASASASWVGDFVKAGSLIATALAGISTAIAGVMASAAKQDLEMEKYARNMMISKDAAIEMKTAIDALGESIADITLTPELMGRYRALVADGRNMKVGGDYQQTMKDFRELIFEFTRLKQEASYAMQWVGYYLMKHLAEPLDKAKKSFKSLNDNLIKNMPIWTEKIARALVYVINVGRHFWDLLKAIGKTAYDIWDSFPRGVKIATAALTGFFLMLKATPFGRMIALVSSLLLLADDYFGYMEGKNAAMGRVWDKLNGYMETAKQKITEWGKALMPLWDGFLGLLDSAKRCYEAVSVWFGEMSKSEIVQDLADAIVELFGAVWDLIDAYMELCGTALSEFFTGMNKTQPMYSFRDALKAIVKMITAMIRGVSSLIKNLTELLKMMKDNKIFKAFWKGLGEVAGVFFDITMKALGAVGRLGQALMALINKDFKGAAKLAGDAVDILFGSSKAEASGIGANDNPSETEKKMWGLAKQVADKTGMKAEHVYAQWWHETAGFKSSLAKENYNFGGMTQVESNGEENKQPDGDFYYMKFESPEDWADYYARYIMHSDYTDARNAETVTGFAHGLKMGGYYGDSEENYIEGLRNGIEKVPVEKNQPIPEINAPQDEEIKNPPEGLRDPDWIDETRDWVNGVYERGKKLMQNADLSIINSLVSQAPPSYANSYAGGTTNYYKVDVGGVNVTNPNASAEEIGNAVGERTASRLSDNVNFFLESRNLTGRIE